MTDGPGSTEWLVLGALYLIAGICMLFWGSLRVFFTRREFGWSYGVLIVLASLYLLGNALKMFVVGPAIIRHHLGDFGFVAMLSVLFYRIAGSVHSGRETFRTANNVRQYEILMRSLRKIPWLALVLSLIYEAFTGLAYAAADIEVAIVGSFDPRDIAAYVTSAVICSLLIHHYASGLLAWSEQHRQLTVTEQADKREAERREMLAERKRRREEGR